MALGFRKSIFGYNCEDVSEYLLKNQNSHKQAVAALNDTINELREKLADAEENNTKLCGVNSDLQSQLDFYKSKYEEVKTLSENIGKLYLVAQTNAKSIINAADEARAASLEEIEDNIAVTKKVVEYAHARGVVVEGELGRLAGVEDDVNVSAEDSSYTRPEEVEEFVEKTGVDSLAIAIGTSHGAYKFKPEQCTRNEEGVLVPPPLRFDILEEIMQRIPGFPIVLHGASSVSQAHVKEINSIGGALPDAVGIPEEQLRKAASLAVCKINIDSDIRLAMTAGIRRVLHDQPDVFDPRTYLTVARSEVKAMVAHKIKDVLGSANTL